MIKRVTAVISVIAVLISSFVITSFAAASSIKVGTVSASAGSTAEITISLQNNPGISALYINVEYDTRLKLKSVSDTGLLKGKKFSSDVNAYPYAVSFDDILSRKDNYSDGAFVKLVFKVPKGTAPESYPVTVSFAEDDIYNAQLENIPFSVINGSVIVKQNSVFSDDDSVYRTEGYMYVAQGLTVSDLKSRSQGDVVVKNNYGLMRDTDILCGGNTVELSDKSIYTCIIKGDTDGNGSVSAYDARLTLRKSVALENFSRWQLICGDIDLSGDITASDARSILRASVGLEALGEISESLQTKELSMSDDLSFAKNKLLTDQSSYYAAGEYVISQLKAFNTKVNIKNYGLNLDDASFFIKEFIYVVPELFYVNKSVRAYYDNGIIEYFEFTFYDNAREKAQEYRDMIADIASKADSRFSPLQKVLFFHDYICSQFSYDTDLSVFEGYTMLKTGRGVCQAYSLLFMSLLGYHGIEARYVTSEEMKHGWNMVKLGSDWYHVDVTWDDPQDDRFGLAYHENLLLSDKAMEKNGHEQWYCCGGNVVCQDSTYDNYFWQDVINPFVYLDNTWYFIDSYSSSFAIYRWNKGEDSTVVRSFNAKWTGYLIFKWDDCFSGFGIYDNKLVYNTEDSVILFDPSTDTSAVIYKESLSGHIFGMTVRDKIYINIASSPDTTKTDIFPITIMNVGDCDGNGRINGKDYSVLMLHCAGYSVKCNVGVADFDLNSKVNNKDADAIRSFVVNR